MQPVTKCVNAPKEICQNVRRNERPKSMAVVKKWCGPAEAFTLDPQDELVDDNWGDWNPWSDCDLVNCTQTRSRKCNNPLPIDGGGFCQGGEEMAYQERNCLLPNNCQARNGGYTPWSEWDECTSSCTKTRRRSCTDPAPYKGGDDCTELGPPFETQICKENEGQCQKNPCNDNPCQNDGHCTPNSSQPSGYICLCSHPFFGLSCENDIDECALSPCENGGSCEDTFGSYDCLCPPGWTGQNCELNLNECEDDTLCKNGGECIDTPGSFICNCPPSLFGKNCEEDIDECISFNGACSPEAHCINTFGGYECKCNQGYQGNGLQCQDIDECVSDIINICEENKFCHNTIGSYECYCKPGFIKQGDKCIEKDVCGEGNYCLNGATCVNDLRASSGYLCKCQIGFIGENCEEFGTEVDSVRFIFSTDGDRAGMNCVLLNEPCDGEEAWNNNYLCTTVIGTIDFRVEGKVEGIDENRKCTQIIEPKDSICWADNFLCMSQFPFEFRWASEGNVELGENCILFNEPEESPETTWNNNYLCVYKPFSI